MKSVTITITDENSVVFARHEFRLAEELKFLREIAEESSMKGFPEDPCAEEFVNEFFSDVKTAARNALAERGE